MTPSTQEHSVVAIYESYIGAEAALKDLQKAGLDMKRLSIIGKDFHTEEHALGFYTSGDRMKFWGVRGAFWGSLWGILFGGAFQCPDKPADEGAHHNQRAKDRNEK